VFDIRPRSTELGTMEDRFALTQLLEHIEQFGRSGKIRFHVALLSGQ